MSNHNLKLFNVVCSYSYCSLYPQKISPLPQVASLQNVEKANSEYTKMKNKANDRKCLLNSTDSRPGILESVGMDPPLVCWVCPARLPTTSVRLALTSGAGNQSRSTFLSIHMTPCELTALKLGNRRPGHLVSGTFPSARSASTFVSICTLGLLPKCFKALYHWNPGWV